jgi:hypothetical protein
VELIVDYVEADVLDQVAKESVEAIDVVSELQLYYIEVHRNAPELLCFRVLQLINVHILGFKRDRVHLEIKGPALAGHGCTAIELVLIVVEFDSKGRARHLLG